MAILEESPYEHVNATVDSLTLEPVDVLVPPRPVGLGEKISPTQSYYLALINLLANQEKRSLAAAFLTSSENPFSMIDWTSDETALDNPTPASSVTSELSLSIDQDSSTSPSRSLPFLHHSTRCFRIRNQRFSYTRLPQPFKQLEAQGICICRIPKLLDRTHDMYTASTSGWDIHFSIRHRLLAGVSIIGYPLALINDEHKMEADPSLRCSHLSP